MVPSETRLSNQGTQRTKGACALNQHHRPRRERHVLPLATRSTECSFGTVTPSLGQDGPHRNLRSNDRSTEDSIDADMRELLGLCSEIDTGFDGLRDDDISQTIDVIASRSGLAIYAQWLT